MAESDRTWVPYSLFYNTQDFCDVLRIIWKNWHESADIAFFNEPRIDVQYTTCSSTGARRVNCYSIRNVTVQEFAERMAWQADLGVDIGFFWYRFRYNQSH